MGNTNKIFFTTTLPYANSVPHVGHALEFVQADAICRYLRSKNNVSLNFNIGLDEHGLKVFQTAEKLGVDPQTFLDDLTVQWKKFCDKFVISYDSFYRTSSPDHHLKVKEFWNICLSNGHIYKKTYKGNYCVGCESFKTDQDLVNGKCPDHASLEIKETEEENYFFRLSSFKEILLEELKSENTLLNESVKFLQPQSKMAELLSLIDGVEDVSISRLRKNLPWGVEVPNDPEHTVYVWFDALINYLVAAGWGSDADRFEDSWSNSIQICGPDNLRFQGVLFQGMLKSVGLPGTTKLLVHGTVLDENGSKMSKSVGNVVDTIEELEKYGLSAMRYYMLAGLNTFGNSSWSRKDIELLHNSDLANDYGNLLSRVIHLLDKQNILIDETLVHEDFQHTVLDILLEATNLFDRFELKLGLQKVNEIFKYCNKYITKAEPWKNKEEAPIVINNLVWVFRHVAEVYEPFIPGIWIDTCSWIEFKSKEPLFPKI